MDVVSSGIAIAGDVFSGLWTFATTHAVIMIALALGLVGSGIALFMSLKGKLFRTRRKRGR